MVLHGQRTRKFRPRDGTPISRGKGKFVEHHFKRLGGEKGNGKIDKKREEKKRSGGTQREERAAKGPFGEIQGKLTKIRNVSGPIGDGA